MARHVLAVTLVLIALLVATHAQAQTAAEPGHHTIGLRLISGVALGLPQNEGILGVGLLLEEALFHHHLEIELVGLYAQHGEHQTMAGELVFKLPWALNDVVEVYAGAGGILAQHNRGGLTVDVGGRLWLSPHFGLGLELDHIHFVGHHSEDSLEAAADIMVRF